MASCILNRNLILVEKRNLKYTCHVYLAKHVDRNSEIPWSWDKLPVKLGLAQSQEQFFPQKKHAFAVLRFGEKTNPNLWLEQWTVMKTPKNATVLGRGINYLPTYFKIRKKYIPGHFFQDPDWPTSNSIYFKCTLLATNLCPGKNNMEPENHRFEKEHHLNQTFTFWGATC